MERLIKVDSIKLHPLNPNTMGKQTLGKLRELIEAEKNYPPLIVNEKPNGEYLLLDGHQRLCVLKELGYEEVKCDVWKVDEKTELVLLSTLNKLKGQFLGLKKDILYGELRKHLTPEQIERITPERKGYLEKAGKMDQEFLERKKEVFSRFTFVQRLDKEKYDYVIGWLKGNMEREKVDEAIYWILKGMEKPMMSGRKDSPYLENGGKGV